MDDEKVERAVGTKHIHLSVIFIVQMLEIQDNCEKNKTIFVQRQSYESELLHNTKPDF